MRRHSVKIFQDNGNLAPENKPTFQTKIFLTREKMHLTDQMKVELDRIKNHTTGMASIRPILRQEIFDGRLTFEGETFITENAKQLRSYKVRLENLLCETDLKE